jgi:ABC-type branched-subunit amino acid transport system ATPase component
MPATTPLLSIEGLDFGYRRRQVLFGVDLDVAAGEVLALLGTNGSGKSTLLRVVSGLERPWAGRIRFDGEDVTGLDALSMVERGFALVLGGRALFPDLSVRRTCWSAPSPGGPATRRPESRSRPRTFPPSSSASASPPARCRAANSSR